MGVVGRPRDWSFRVEPRGRFRTARDAPWKAVEALQYTSGSPDVARLFYLVPPVTALMAFALFGERLDALAIAGMVLIAIGVALARRR